MHAAWRHDADTDGRLAALAAQLAGPAAARPAG
jgi:hypothetical protein